MNNTNTPAPGTEIPHVETRATKLEDVIEDLNAYLARRHGIPERIRDLDTTVAHVRQIRERPAMYSSALVCLDDADAFLSPEGRMADDLTTTTAFAVARICDALAYFPNDLGPRTLAARARVIAMGR